MNNLNWHDAHTNAPLADDAYLTWTRAGDIPAHYDTLMYRVNDDRWYYTIGTTEIDCDVDYWLELPDPPEK